jgi:hypothetical protein
MRRHGPVSYIALAVLTAACVSTGSSHKSGVEPKDFSRPPFYAGAAVPNVAGVVHLPIRHQAADRSEPKGDAGSPAAVLVAEMNAYLDSIATSAKLLPNVPEVGTAPDVHFGCGALSDCISDGDENADHRLHLWVGRPSPDWIGWIGTALDSASHDKALLITMELGEYWPRRKGFSLRKEVRLGSGYTVVVPWLTSLEQSIAVVQLTGALVGRDGRAIRIGAEGMLAKRTRIAISALGATELVTDDDVERLLTLRRDDLLGQPLVWQVALRNLVSQLTGQVGQS